MKVAVVGAGVAGLQQGRALQKRGIDFHIYEADAQVGGVWRVTTHLQGAQGKEAINTQFLQSRRALYLHYVFFRGWVTHLTSGNLCLMQSRTHTTNSRNSPGLKS